MPRKTNSQRLDDPGVPKSFHELAYRFAALEGELHNGIRGKVRLLMSLQWVQITILVAVLSGLIGGMWWLTQQSELRTQKVIEKLEEHIDDSAPAKPKSHSGVDQRLDRRTHNPEGEGSSPSPAIGGVVPAGRREGADYRKARSPAGLLGVAN